MLVRISATNRGPQAAPLHLLPTLWFKNDWSWTDDAQQAAHRDRSCRRRRDGAARRAPHAARALAVLRAAARSAVHGERVQRAAPVEHAQRPAVRQGRVSRVSSCNGTHDAVNPARTAPRPRRTTRFRVGPGETVTVRLRLRAGEPPWRASRAGVRCDVRHAHRGGRRVLQARHAVRPSGRHAQRAAPGVRRHAVEQAVLPLHGRALARGRSRRADAARIALEGPQPRLVAHVGRRRAVHAGQMGVPVVRRVGHGVPHDSRSR